MQEHLFEINEINIFISINTSDQFVQLQIYRGKVIFYRILCGKLLLSIWEIYSLQIQPLQLRVTARDNMRNNLKDRAFWSLQQVLISSGTLSSNVK